MRVTSASYDYVIVGAGSAGCLLANRLSAGGARVLLLEAGGTDRRPEVKIPAAFPNQFQTAIDWNLISEPEPGLCNRRLYLPRGKMLGGLLIDERDAVRAWQPPRLRPLGERVRSGRLELRERAPVLQAPRSKR